MIIKQAIQYAVGNHLLEQGYGIEYCGWIINVYVDHSNVDRICGVFIKDDGVMLPGPVWQFNYINVRTINYSDPQLLDKLVAGIEECAGAEWRLNSAHRTEAILDSPYE